MSEIPSLKLPPIREKAADLLANGAKQVQVAEQCGVRKETVNKWCKDPDFQARIRELRTDLQEQATEIIAGAVPDAAKTVAGISAGEIAGDSKILSARLKAALWILDFMKQKKMPVPSPQKRRSSTRPEVDPEDARRALEA